MRYQQNGIKSFKSEQTPHFINVPSYESNYLSHFLKIGSSTDFAVVSEM